MAIANRNVSAKSNRTASNGKVLNSSNKISGTASDTGSNTGSNTASKKNVSRKSSAQNENWIDSFSAPVSRVERDVETFLTKEPLITVGAALGLGLVAGFLMKKYRAAEAASPSRGKKSSGREFAENAASVAFTGFLTKGLTTMASRVESEFGTFRSGGIADIKNNLEQFITEELAEKPFETIATVLGAGFGIANLETSAVKDGAIRVAKGIALRTLEGSSSQTNYSQGEMNA